MWRVIEVAMFWNDDEDEQRAYRPPTDIFDLTFKLHGQSIAIDHAASLANALRDKIAPEACQRLGVHGIRLAISGNGWMRSEADDARVPLPRRARLAVRLHRRDYDEVMRISHSRIDLEGHEIGIGESRVRDLSTLDTLFARSVACAPDQSESDFLTDVDAELRTLGIEANKMLCGRSGRIRTEDGGIFTRALLIAGLRPRDSVALQRHGLGPHRLLGCGLFVAHKGIDPVSGV